MEPPELVGKLHHIHKLGLPGVFSVKKPPKTPCLVINYSHHMQFILRKMLAGEKFLGIWIRQEIQLF